MAWVKNIFKALVILGLIVFTAIPFGSFVFWIWLAYGILVIYDMDNEGHFFGNQSKWFLAVSGTVVILLFYGAFSVIAWAISS